MCLVFSTGLFFVGVLMLWRNRLALLRFIRATFLSVMLVIGGVSYWLIPFVIKNAQGSVFDIANARSFSVAALSGHGILTTLATGYGFWGAAQPWASSFIWPYHYPFIFWPLFFILFAIVIYGAYHAFHGRPLIASFFCSLWVIAIVFSGGLIGPFGGVNQWLYETIPFWSGFRDSQKWSALIMISYAFFGAWGTSELFQVLRRYRPSLAPMAKLLLLIPVLYTFTLPGGFSRQLQPVWYPASWHQANEILASRIQPGEQRVLYLPWHQYYSLPFNHNLLTINPARAFFDVQIVQSENPEVGVIDREPDELHTKIDLLITNSTEYTDSEIAQLLSNYGISYVMVGDSVDPLLDVFLLKLANISLFRPIFVGEGLTLYEILI